MSKINVMLIACLMLITCGNSGGTTTTTSTSTFSCRIGNVSCSDQASCTSCQANDCSGCTCSDGSPATTTFSAGGQGSLNECIQCGITIASTSESSCN